MNERPTATGDVVGDEVSALMTGGRFGAGSTTTSTVSDSVRAVGVPTPVVDSLIHIACAATGQDYKASGRTLIMVHGLAASVHA